MDNSSNDDSSSDNLSSDDSSSDDSSSDESSSDESSSDESSSDDSSSDDSSSDDSVGDHTRDDETPIHAPPFVGERLVVRAQSVSTFYQSAFQLFTDVLGPRTPPTQHTRAVALVLGPDSVVSMRIVPRGASLTCYEKNEIAYCLRRNKRGDDVWLATDNNFMQSKAQRMHATSTSWSQGCAVYWIMAPSSQFASATQHVVHTNHDFELYDVGVGYKGVLRYDGERCCFGRLECEAFVCNIIKSRGDRFSTYPPRPTRALQRVTDISFSPTSRTVDVRSAMRFSAVVLEAYAMPTKGVPTWDDIFGRTWDETRGKLVWLLLGLDDDDLYHCGQGVSHALSPTVRTGSGCTGVEMELESRRLAILLLQAPWFITANALDVFNGVAIPLGATLGGRDPWYDVSLGKWKSKLGRRAFKGCHVEAAVYDCSHTCDLVPLIRDCHEKETAAHVNARSIVYRFVNMVECTSCDKQYDDRNPAGDCRSEVKPCTGKGCGSMRFRSVGKRLQARCNAPGCGLRSQWINCACCTNDGLAAKQFQQAKLAVDDVRADFEEVAARVVNARTVRCNVRVQHEDESYVDYVEYKSEHVDDVIDTYKDSSHALTVIVKSVEEESAYGVSNVAFMADTRTTSTDLSSQKMVDDAYTTLTMNATWRVEVFRRDGAVVSYETSGRKDRKTCKFCASGVCEVMASKQHDVCGSCNRVVKINRREVPLPFPWRVVADLDLLTESVPTSYSCAGIDIDTATFYESFLRNMARPFY